MPNAIVRNVLASLILVVLCFVIGAQAAENSKISVGIIVAIVGVVFMLWLGPRCWVLIYLLPPLISLLPIPGKLQELPTIFLISGGVLLYWMLLWMMGYVRFKWRSLWIMDFLVLLMFIYMVISYMRHPVSLAIFGWDTEYVGGKEYAWAIIATLHYIAVSCIPCSYDQSRKVFSWGIKISVGGAILAVVLSLVGIRGGTDITELGDAAANTRFGMFVQLGVYGIYCLYGMNPIMSVLSSPKLLFGCLLSLCGIVISGARELLMGNCFIIAALAIVKRELWCLTLLGLLFYGGLVYLSSEGVVKSFPHGIQRSLSVLPGVEIQRDIGEGAQHSSDWRIVMWKWALDKRTGYIHDYMWGDGFGQSVDYLRRETTAMMRGTSVYGDQEFFASTGVWHSGVITTIHRLGYVGLALVSLVYVYGTYMMFRVCMSLKGTPLFFPAIFFCMGFAGELPIYMISAGTLPYFFSGYMMLTFIKLFYCIGREQGFIIPWYMRKRYVPQMIREHEEQIRPAM
ncbi:MAG: hypothetical protein IKA23_01035 [Akkermansia sp.]|nr:hypothetical protein [Akkermansia sp.]